MPLREQKKTQQTKIISAGKIPHSVSVEEIELSIRRHTLTKEKKDDVRVHQIVNALFPLKSKERPDRMLLGEQAELLFRKVYPQGIYNPRLFYYFTVDGRKYRIVGHPDIIDPEKKLIIDIKLMLKTKKKKEERRVIRTLTGEKAELRVMKKTEEEEMLKKIPRNYLERIKAQLSLYKWLLEKITKQKWDTAIAWVDANKKEYVIVPMADIDSNYAETLLRKYLKSRIALEQFLFG